MTRRNYARSAYASIGLAVLSVALFSCGGGGSGEGLVLLEFRQANVDTVALNEVLKFEFTADVDPETVTSASIQIRRGDEFGATVDGEFEVVGTTAQFWPKLAGRCDGLDGGLIAGTRYKVTVVGLPETFAVRDLQGRSLMISSSWEFTTRLEADPDLFLDPIPGVAPSVILTAPSVGAAAISTGSADAPQRIVLTFSENLDPCSVTENSVSVKIYEVGGTLPESVENPENGNLSGFVTGTGDVSDQLPDDPTTWGSDTGGVWPGGPQTLPSSVHLVQDYGLTQIIVSPLTGRDPANPTGGGAFPDNVLIVVRLDPSIQDFGGSYLAAYALSFTTENTAGSTGEYVMEVEGETPFTSEGTTADVNTPRSPSLVQGYLLFAGDGDNGERLDIPSLPETAASNCGTPLQPNDGTLDDLDVTTDYLLHTGATDNTCPNTTDGSTAVIWEFRKFTIRSTGTVRIIGVNPAIILVQQDMVIEPGGRLIVRGHNAGGSPRGAGRNGYAWTSYSTTVTLGGDGVAGGGDGGDAAKYDTADYGGDGYSAFGSADGRDVKAGEGAGLGGSIHLTTYPSSPGTSQGGGGGGHAMEGGSSTNVLGTGHKMKGGTTRGQGGAAYPDAADAVFMYEPSAGGGGGAGGNEEWDGSYKGIYSTGGGSGGAGGGFVDITSSGDIRIHGTIDAAGSRAGDGTQSSYYAGPGGGGGGAGGGIRLLTPNQILLGPDTVITAAGGSGGVSPNGSSGTGGPQNHGAAGSHGRIVMEDGDSVITGIAQALLIPTDGQEGFHRGKFDSTRFKGGGLTPEAITDLIWMGPLNPTYVDPVRADFIVGAPAVNTPGPGNVVLEISARGYAVLSDGSPDVGAPTPYQVVGQFIDSGIASDPEWVPGAGLASLSGYEYLQFRFQIRLDPDASPSDPGPYLDRWTIKYVSDN